MFWILLDMFFIAKSLLVCNGTKHLWFAFALLELDRWWTLEEWRLRHTCIVRFVTVLHHGDSSRFGSLFILIMINFLLLLHIGQVTVSYRTLIIIHSNIQICLSRSNSLLINGICSLSPIISRMDPTLVMWAGLGVDLFSSSLYVFDVF